MEKKNTDSEKMCPAQALLKLLSGRFKPEIFRMSLNGGVRFNELLRTIDGAHKQGIALALKELVDAGLSKKNVLREKPLYIEYVLTEIGQSLIPVFLQLEQFENHSQ